MYMPSNSPIETETKLTEDLNRLKSCFDNNELVMTKKKGKKRSMIFKPKRLNNLESKEMEVNLNGVKINGTTSYK